MFTYQFDGIIIRMFHLCSTIFIRLLRFLLKNPFEARACVIVITRSLIPIPEGEERQRRDDLSMQLWAADVLICPKVGRRSAAGGACKKPDTLTTR